MIKLKREYFVVGTVSLGLTLSSFIVANSNRLTAEKLHDNLKITSPKKVMVSTDTENNFSLIRHDRTFVGFKEKMGYRESRCNYFLVNDYGYMGKYQFGKTALNFYGVQDKETFLNTPGLQEKLFQISLSYNKWNLRKEIERYVGKRVGGILITESGILAAAHLAGAGSVKQFLKSSGSFNFADANGTTVANYMKSFQGYDLSHIEADKLARM